MAGGCTLMRRLGIRFRTGTACSLDGGFEIWSSTVQNRFFRAAAEYQCRASISLSCPISLLVQRNFSSDSGVAKKKKKQTPLQERKMIDKFRVHVRGGEGGAGCTSFRKSRQARHGSADGGSGGRGGDVILVSSAAVWDFSNLQHHLNGGRGGPGSSKKKIGSRGLDKVPVGTVIHLVRGSIPSLDQNVREESTLEEWESGNLAEEDTTPVDSTIHFRGGSVYGRDSEERTNILSPKLLLMDDGDSEIITPAFARKNLRLLGEYSDGSDLDVEFTDDDEVGDSDQDRTGPGYVQSSVAELVGIGQSLTLANGGEGGKGNAAMARGRGADKALPSLEHEQGRPGSEADLILELKTIADVGLVGAPNAGKSTLLGSLSRAKPVTGYYKFTTLRPNIGRLEFEDYFSFTVADIPGLIEGAHENRGLGHAFLRHIERTKVLAYVVDLSAGIGENPGPLPWNQIQELVFELEQYKTGLSKRPSVVVANKIDEVGAPEALEELKRVLPHMQIFPVCAVLEEGVDVLKEGLRNLVENTQLDTPTLSQIREL